MHRKRFVARTLLSGAGVAILHAPLRAAQFEYKSAHPNSASHPMHVWQVQLWKQVARETGGRLVVQVFPNGQLGGQEAVLAQLRVGAIQMISVANSVYSEVVPAAAIDSIGFSFKDAPAAWRTMNGPLGDYVRKEFDAKGLYVAKGALFDLGMREVTATSRPIRNADDFAGFKIRVVPSRLVVDLFRTLGASTVTGLSGNEIYTALQTHIIDGFEQPYVGIESGRFYEVQKYLSVTNHLWTGEWYVMNADAWKALPSDIQGVVNRNVAKYCLSARDDVYRVNDTLAEKLRRLGMVFNNADAASMRARLGPYYGRGKAELGATLWSLLETSVGKLG